MHIAGLNVYPIKGARGIACKNATYTECGLALDRMFIIIRSDNGKMITQRQVPRLALVSEC